MDIVHEEFNKLKASVRSFGNKLLDEAAHAKETGMNDLMFGATAGAGVIDAVLRIIDTHMHVHANRGVATVLHNDSDQCPRCGLKAESMLHKFCTRGECPVR